MRRATIHRPALLVAASLLAAGCSQAGTGSAEPRPHGAVPADAVPAAPLGPDRSTDSGRKTLLPSPIGQIAPEQPPVPKK